jgi:hypothetical protein
MSFVGERREGGIMKRKPQLVVEDLGLLLLSLIPAPRMLSQHAHEHNSKVFWKTEMVKLWKSLWAGDVRVKSGMYHVKHLEDGTKHVMVFKPVALPAGYKEFSMFEGEEVKQRGC